MELQQNSFMTAGQPITASGAPPAQRAAASGAEQNPSPSVTAPNAALGDSGSTPAGFSQLLKSVLENSQTTESFDGKIIPFIAAQGKPAPEATAAGDSFSSASLSPVSAVMTIKPDRFFTDAASAAPGIAPDILLNEILLQAQSADQNAPIIKADNRAQPQPAKPSLANYAGAIIPIPAAQTAGINAATGSKTANGEMTEPSEMLLPEQPEPGGIGSSPLSTHPWLASDSSLASTPAPISGITPEITSTSAGTQTPAQMQTAPQTPAALLSPKDEISEGAALTPPAKPPLQPSNHAQNILWVTQPATGGEAAAFPAEANLFAATPAREPVLAPEAPVSDPDLAFATPVNQSAAQNILNYLPEAPLSGVALEPDSNRPPSIEPCAPSPKKTDMPVAQTLPISILAEQTKPDESGSASISPGSNPSDNFIPQPSYENANKQPPVNMAAYALAHLTATPAQPALPAVTAQTSAADMPGATKPLNAQGRESLPGQEKPNTALNGASPAIPAAAISTQSQNATAPQQTMAGGENFAQVMAQTADSLAVPVQESIPAQTNADMGDAQSRSVNLIDRQDANRTQLPQSTPRAEAHPAQVSPPIRDIAVHMAQNNETGINRFQLRLDPPELGRVDVRMEISPEGKLSAVIAVERPETLDLLQRDSRALERSLTDAGLKTDSNSLSFSLKGGRQDNPHSGGFGHTNGAGNALADDWEDTSAATPVRFANRAVNIRI